MKSDQDIASRLRPSLWYWLLLPAVFILVQALFEAERTSLLAYSDFLPT